jgi:hypothetical protein
LCFANRSLRATSRSDLPDAGYHGEVGDRAVLRLAAAGEITAR